MKKLLSKIVPGLVLIFLFSSASSWAQGHIATIDLRKVFDNYWKTKQADASLKDRAADMEKEFKSMTGDFDKGKEEYRKLQDGANDQAVSADEREKRKKAAEDKLKQLKESEDNITQYRRQALATLDEQKKRMRENILTEIRNVLNSKAKSGGFSMVVDTAAQSADFTPVFLFSNNENDLTDDLLKQLNAAAPPPTDTGKPEEKKEPAKGEKKKQ